MALVKKAEATATNVSANQHSGVLSSHLICLSPSCRQGSISPPICLSSTITKEQERVKKKSGLKQKRAVAEGSRLRRPIAQPWT